MDRFMRESVNDQKMGSRVTGAVDDINNYSGQHSGSLHSSLYEGGAQPMGKGKSIHSSNRGDQESQQPSHPQSHQRQKQDYSYYEEVEDEASEDEYNNNNHSAQNQGKNLGQQVQNLGNNSSKLAHQSQKNQKRPIHIDNFQIDFEEADHDENSFGDIQPQSQKQLALIGQTVLQNPRNGHPAAALNNNQQHLMYQGEENEEEEVEEYNLDELTPEQLQELLKNPKLAALFANMQNEGELFEDSQYQIEIQEDDDQGILSGFGEMRLHANGDDDEYGDEQIDIDQLPDDQQYLLGDDYDQSEDSQVVRGDVKFLNQSAAQDEFNNEHFYENEEGELVQRDCDSDYCEDLAEIYLENGDEDDVIRYKGIHLMIKYDENDQRAYNEHESQTDKYHCPQTGAHFEFLEMCRRLKKMQKKRAIIDQVIEEEIQRAKEEAEAKAEQDRLERERAQEQEEQRKQHARQQSEGGHRREQSIKDSQSLLQNPRRSGQDQSRYSQESGMVLKSQAAVNQSQSNPIPAQVSHGIVKQEVPAAAAAVVEQAPTYSRQAQSVVQPSMNDFKENVSEQQPTQSISKRHSGKSSTKKERPRDDQIKQISNQANTRNVVQSILPVKVKAIKEPYAGRVLPTENNLVTEEGIYNSFHFYGSSDLNSRTGRQQLDFLSDGGIDSSNGQDALNQRQNQVQPTKQKGKSSVLKNLLDKKSQLCVTEAEGGNSGKISRKKQQEYDMFFNSNAESIYPSAKPQKAKVNLIQGPFGMSFNQQQQQQMNTFDQRTNIPLTAHSHNDTNLLSLSQMLINQQLRDHEAANQFLRSSHQLQNKQNHQLLQNIHARQAQLQQQQINQQQPNVFKFKKGTEKLTNKRTPSANSKSKKRNNSQSQNNAGAGYSINAASALAQGVNGSTAHNKTHSLNQIGSGTSIGIASLNGGAQSASLRNKNIGVSGRSAKGNSGSQNQQNQIQQLLMSFYQGQGQAETASILGGNGQVLNQLGSQSRTQYSKSIYDGKGSNTLRDGQSQRTTKTSANATGAPKIVVSGSTHLRNQGEKSLNQIQNIYSSIVNNTSKSASSKAAAAQNQTKKAKITVKKQTFGSGLQARGNTVDAKYGQSLNPSVAMSLQGNPMASFQLNQQRSEANSNAKFSNNFVPMGKTSNAPASHCTTAGMNSQNASRPTSAIKKMKSQSPTSVISKNGERAAAGKVTNLSSLDYQNLLTYKAQLGQNEQSRERAQRINQRLTTTQGKSGERAEAIKVIHKKTNSISSSKYSSNNIQKSRQKSAVGIGATSKNAPSNIDYNSHVLDQILMTHLETQPAEYNYSTFNDGVLFTQGDTQDQRIYTMNSNKKSSKENRLNANNFILNTGSSSKKVRQKSSSKISTSKSRQKSNLAAVIGGGHFTAHVNGGGVNSNFNSNQQHHTELFKPMQISNHIKQSAKLRTKPSSQMKIEINNVISKINAKQAEASRTQAHPITSLTNPSLIRAEQQISSHGNSTNMNHQHSSILQQNQHIQNQLAQVGKKVKQSRERQLQQLQGTQPFQTHLTFLSQDGALSLNNHTNLNQGSFVRSSFKASILKPSSTQMSHPSGSSQIHSSLTGTTNSQLQSQAAAQFHSLQNQQQSSMNQSKGTTNISQISKRYNSIKSTGRGGTDEESITTAATMLMDKKRQGSKNQLNAVAPHSALTKLGQTKLKPQRINSGNRNSGKNLFHQSPPRNEQALSNIAGLNSYDFANPSSFMAMSSHLSSGNGKQINGSSNQRASSSGMPSSFIAGATKKRVKSGKIGSGAGGCGPLQAVLGNLIDQNNYNQASLMGSSFAGAGVGGLICQQSQDFRSERCETVN